MYSSSLPESYIFYPAFFFILSLALTELIVVNKKEISIKNMGYILKQARLKMGYTRDQLSERVGISHRYLTAIENEERRPSYEVLSKLLRNLGLCTVPAP